MSFFAIFPLSTCALGAASHEYQWYNEVRISRYKSRKRLSLWIRNCLFYLNCKWFFFWYGNFRKIKTIMMTLSSICKKWKVNQYIKNYLQFKYITAWMSQWILWISRITGLTCDCPLIIRSVDGIQCVLCCLSLIGYILFVYSQYNIRSWFTSYCIASYGGLQWFHWKNIQMLLLTVWLPVIVHVTSSEFVSSMPPSFPVMVGWSGLTEIVCILFTQCMVYTFGRTLNYNYK